MAAKVVSKKQLAANRANASRSTGPRTEKGKARVARNPIKHGLLARDLALDDNEGAEDSKDLKDFLNELLERLQPNDPLERLLVERIAACHWRLRRSIRFESRSILEARRDFYAPMNQLSRNARGTQDDPLDIVLPGESDLKKLVAYETLVDRQLHRTLNHLRQFRAAPPIPPPTPSSDIDTPPTPPPAPGTPRKSNATLPSGKE